MLLPFSLEHDLSLLCTLLPCDPFGAICTCHSNGSGSLLALQMLLQSKSLYYFFNQFYQSQISLLWVDYFSNHQKWCLDCLDMHLQNPPSNGTRGKSLGDVKSCIIIFHYLFVISKVNAVRRRTTSPATAMAKAFNLFIKIN